MFRGEFGSIRHRVISDITNHNPRSGELTGSRQIDVEAELPHLFRIPRIPSVSFRGSPGLWQLCNVGTRGQDGIVRDVCVGSHKSTLTLREEHRLRVFENKVLRKIFGAKRDEVTGEWRKLHNAELHALYSSPDIIRNIRSRRLRWAGHVARMGESRNAYRVLVGRPEGKRSLGRPRRRWEDNIEMDLREVGYDGRDWINLAQDRDQWRAYVRAAMNLRSLMLAGNERVLAGLFERGYMRRCDGMVLLVLFHGESVCSDCGGKKVSERIPNLSAEQSDGITVFRISPMTSLMIHRYRTGSISLQRWWQSPSAAISESDWFLYRAGISRRMTSCTVVSWRRTHRHDTTVHDVIRLLIPALYKNQSDSLMAADGDCHHLCKLMAPVRHRWSINDVIGGIRNTVMPSDCSPNIKRKRKCAAADLLLLDLLVAHQWRIPLLIRARSSCKQTNLVQRNETSAGLANMVTDLGLTRFKHLLSKNLKVRIYKTVILPVVLYGCETWTLTLREEQRLRVFENKVLRKIFGAKRDEITGEWRKLHNAELHALYPSPDIMRNIKSRRLRWAGHVARMGESRNA
ncbi:hypothetical protein ANN_12283 [Periplaneta americana]|uniref:Endonuclease-reverse transcriptase n=1 Tax=Periplaneta americana TaxID=6978 RepID=A0ABQ8TG28_PERAM|nr:hypothetical protein ANN_12283 [Periplaneta americana]